MDAINQRRREKYAQNRDAINQKRRARYAQNRERVNQRRREKYAQSRDKINQKRRANYAQKRPPREPKLYPEHTVKDLKQLAKNAGLRGYSRLKRADLIETLEDNLIISSNILENEPTRELRNPFRIQREASALNRFTDQWKIEGRAGYSPQRFLNAVKRSVVGLLSNNRRIKVKMILMCLMEKENSQTGETVTREAPFHSDKDPDIILRATNLEELYEKWVGKILEEIDNFTESGSGWRFVEIIHLKIHTVIYRPMGGESYIPLPEFLAKKQALINYQK